MKPIIFRSLVLIGLMHFESILSQNIIWEKSIGGTRADYLFDIQPTADYGFIAAGSSLSDKSGNKTTNNQGNLDYFIWKMDEKGEVVWQKNYGGQDIDLLKFVKGTNDGGFLLVGSSDSPKSGDKGDDSFGGFDFWIIKLDAAGNEQWQRTIGGTSNDEPVMAVEVKEGGFLIAGNSASPVERNSDGSAKGNKTAEHYGATDIWLVKLDQYGQKEWEKTYGGQYTESLRSVQPVKDGGFILGGYSNSPMSGNKTVECYGEGDFWVLRVDKMGQIIWQKALGGESDEQLFQILACNDRSFILGGYSFSRSSGNKSAGAKNGSDIWLIKIDGDASTIWEKSYDFGPSDMLVSLNEDEEGKIIVGGHVSQDSEASGVHDLLVVKLDSKGEVIWEQTYGSNDNDVMRKAIETRDKGILIAGTSSPKPPVVRRKKSKAWYTDMLQSEAAISEELSDLSTKARGEFNSAASHLAESANPTFNQSENLRIGVKSPIVLEPSAGTKRKSAPGMSAPAVKEKFPGSGDKKSSFGNGDFWIIKIKDKEKKDPTRTSIEAIPNPTTDFTNVIIVDEFKEGVLSVYDLSGRRLQNFKITTGNTVPVSLGNLPQGIYIVEVKAKGKSESVKIIKTK